MVKEFSGRYKATEVRDGGAREKCFHVEKRGTNP